MRIFIILAFYSSAVFSSADSQSSREVPLRTIINGALDFSLRQSLRMAGTLDSIPGVLPKTVNSSGQLEICSPSWWTSGFFPGTLWYLYEYSGNDTLREFAKKFTSRVEKEQFTTNSHDVGFIINCSFGNGYRLTGDPSYRNILQRAAHSLAARFNPAVGCIRSWDYSAWSRKWQYPVIIDNMMNLELLEVAAQEFHEQRLSDIASAHAHTTMKNHFRPDNSSFHVVSYDTLSGNVLVKQTAQGYSDASSWARGQAWGLYGFTMMYRFTHDTSYLHLAERIADFIVRHPRFPEDKIPYWDFDAPDIPNSRRDASAGAIICSALIELSGSVKNGKAKEYLSVAERQIRILSSPAYRNQSGRNGNFILLHSVGNMRGGTEIDVPLSYADYYFVEALLRMKKLYRW